MNMFHKAATDTNKATIPTNPNSGQFPHNDELGSVSSLSSMFTANTCIPTKLTEAIPNVAFTKEWQYCQ
eukprot:10935420-Ditylum_brightwellii.AAC.1